MQALLRLVGWSSVRTPRDEAPRAAEIRPQALRSQRGRLQGIRLGSAAAAGLALAGCSGGGQGSAPGAQAPAVTPAEGQWVGGDAVPQVRLLHEVDPTSVSDRTLILLDGAALRVPGQVEVDGNVVRFRPAADLADDEYALNFEREVYAKDGGPMALPTSPVRFSVRPRGPSWSAPAVALGGAGDAPPIFASDLVGGGGSLAWIHEGQVLVAEYDRDAGWRPASVIDRSVGSSTPDLHVARGAGTVVVATVLPDPFSADLVLIRAWLSRRFGSGGTRIWDPLPPISAAIAGVLRLHVSATGQAVLLLASTIQTTSALRAYWLSDQGGNVDMVSGPGERFALDGLYSGSRGELAVAWTVTARTERQSHVRVWRQAGWETVRALPGAPTDGGIALDGNVWLRVPDSPSSSRYVRQEGLAWRSDTPVVPAGWAARVDRSGRLVVLDWRSDAAGESVRSLLYEGTGQLVSEQTIAGPTQEPLSFMALLGDVDTELMAVWREGQTVQHAIRRSANSRWSEASPWRRAFLPVPVERAVLTPAGARTWVSWVEGEFLETTHVTPFARAPRPSVNVRVSPSPTPLRDEMLFGTSTGALLVVWAQDGYFHAQDVRD
ncbi:MAG: Ig-like domain-containing protein [Planctomycetota bacterium]